MRPLLHLFLVQQLLAVVSTGTGSGTGPTTNSKPSSTSSINPPRGWNSWDCCDHSNESQVLKVAQFMRDNLLHAGYDHVVVDIGWSIRDGGPSLVEGHDPTAVEVDAWGRLYPSAKLFPSVKDGNGFTALAKAIHSMGLKFGWHMMRGIPREAVARRLPIKGSNYTAEQAALVNSTCEFNSWMYGVNASSPAGIAYYRSVASLYAEWGADFIKADCFYVNVQTQFQEVVALSQAFRAQNRPVMLSWVAEPLNASNLPSGDLLPVLETLRPYGNMFRVGNDVWDVWSAVVSQLHRLPGLSSFQSGAGPPGFEKFGSWADPDMLPLGRVGHADKRAPNYPERQSRLSPCEQQSLMSLWVIFRAPLFFGGDLSVPSALHPTTRALITNNETLVVQRDARDSRQVYADNSSRVWVAVDVKRPSTARFVAAFNLDAQGMRNITIDFATLGLSAQARCRVRDLWGRSDLGVFTGGFEASAGSHCGPLFEVSVV
jgi:alpha-galactosidase|eukprot:COSAG01_NODE_5243_length_4389_cov_13.417016_1_plen_487_part_00